MRNAEPAPSQPSSKPAGCVRGAVRSGQRDRVVREVCAREACIKAEACTCLFGCIQQQDVQAAARDRADHFGIIEAIALQVHLAIQRMHHASAHHHRVLQHDAGEAGLAQGVQAAFGQRKVDRAPTEEAGTWIGRRSNTSTSKPRCASRVASREPTRPAPMMVTCRSCQAARPRLHGLRVAQAVGKGVVERAGAIRITSGSRQSPSTPCATMKSNSDLPGVAAGAHADGKLRAAAAGLVRRGDFQHVTELR